MNRKQRRAAARRKDHPGIPGGYFIGTNDVLAALDFHCPDCNSEIHRYTDALGIQRVQIHHDDTCPTWQAMQVTKTERNQ